MTDKKKEKTYYINDVFNRSFPDKYPDRPMYLEVVFNDPNKKVQNLYIYKEILKTSEVIQTTTYTTIDGYRYGFNNMEKDDQVKGRGNSYDFGARMLDPRLGRWLTIDPLASKYPNLSPYVFVANNPIRLIDPDGQDIIIGELIAQYNLIEKPTCLGMIARTSTYRNFVMNEKTGEYDFHVNSVTNYYYELQNKDNKLETNNPGLIEFAETHERAHYKANVEAAYMEIDYEFNGKTYTGRYDQVLNQINKEFNLEKDNFTKNVRANIKAFDGKIQSATVIQEKNKLMQQKVDYVNRMNKKSAEMGKRISTDLSKVKLDLINRYIENANILNEHDGENGINAKTSSQLDPNSNAYKYQNGTKPIIIDNQEIPSCKHE